jgi:hypothetical protein
MPTRLKYADERIPLEPADFLPDVTPDPDAKIDVKVTVTKDKKTIVVRVPMHDLKDHTGLIAVHVCFLPRGADLSEADAIAGFLSGTERFEDDGTDRELRFPIKPLTGHPDPAANPPSDEQTDAVCVLEFVE